MSEEKTLERSLEEGIITREEYDRKIGELSSKQKAGVVAEGKSQPEDDDKPMSDDQTADAKEPSKIEADVSISDETEDKPGQKRSSDRIVMYAMIALVFAFGIFFIASRMMPSGQPEYTIDDLNEQNIEGELDPSEGYIYRGAYSFVRLDGLWYAQVQTPGGTKELNIALRWGPRDLEEVPVTGSLNSTFTDSEELYVTFDPMGEQLDYVALAVGEFDRNIVVGFGKAPIAACSTGDNPSCDGRPIVTCNDTDKAVVYFDHTGDPAVVKEGNCLTLKGTGLELLKSVDRILLEWYGIME